MSFGSLVPLDELFKTDMIAITKIQHGGQTSRMVATVTNKFM